MDQRDRTEVGGQGPSLGARYELLEELGRGGMGVVRRARERSTGREVAVKLITLNDLEVEARLRFRREAELAASLQHPGVLTVYAAGEEPGRAWIACELVPEARALDQAWSGLSRLARAGLVRDAARALGHAHARGVVHRDVKAQNLLVGSDGRLRVTDFGLALLRGGTKITDTGTLLGTPRAMAPEQVKGDRARIGPWTDVWALGVLLYEALTGQRPHEGRTLVETMRRIVEVDPPRPRSLDPAISEALEAVCLRALRRDPGERWPDGAAMAEALDAALAATAGRGRAGRLLLGLVGGVALAAAATHARWLPAVDPAAGAAAGVAAGRSGRPAAVDPGRGVAQVATAPGDGDPELAEVLRLIDARQTADARRRLEGAIPRPALLRCLARLLRQGQGGPPDRAQAELLEWVAGALEEDGAPPGMGPLTPAALEAEAGRIALAPPLDPLEMAAQVWLEERAARLDAEGRRAAAVPLWRVATRRWGSTRSAAHLAQALEACPGPAALREALVCQLLLARQGNVEREASGLRGAASLARRLEVADRQWILSLARTSVARERVGRGLRCLAESLRETGTAEGLAEARQLLVEALGLLPLEAETCDDLATMLEAGQGGSPDPERARELRQRAVALRGEGAR